MILYLPIRERLSGRSDISVVDFDFLELELEAGVVGSLVLEEREVVLVLLLLVTATTVVSPPPRCTVVPDEY